VVEGLQFLVDGATGSSGGSTCPCYRQCCESRHIKKNLVHKITRRIVILRENNSKIVIFLLKNLVIRSKITIFAAEIKNKRSLIYGKNN
jgi:hypothetical protein